MQSIITKRCFLRDYGEGDQEDFVALNVDPKVREHMGGALSEAEAEALFQESLDDTDPREGVRWAIFDRKTDEYLGHFFFVPWEGGEQMEMEMGILLREECWGQGLGVEVAGALLKQAFETMPINRVWATADREHAGAQILMRKIGMDRCEVGQDEKGIYDVFGMTREQFAVSPLANEEKDQESPG